jgi:hypothetical protein
MTSLAISLHHIIPHRLHICGCVPPSHLAYTPAQVNACPAPSLSFQYPTRRANIKQHSLPMHCVHLRTDPDGPQVKTGTFKSQLWMSIPQAPSPPLKSQTKPTICIWLSYQVPLCIQAQILVTLDCTMWHWRNLYFTFTFTFLLKLSAW